MDQFAIPGYSKPYRFDRNRNGGGVFIHIREDIPRMELKIYNILQMILKVFLSKLIWLKLSGFFVAAISHLAGPIFLWKTLDKYSKHYDKFMLAIPLWAQCQEHCQGQHLFYKCIES